MSSALEGVGEGEVMIYHLCGSGKKRAGLFVRIQIKKDKKKDAKHSTKTTTLTIWAEYADVLP